jgi:hypothetical protein
MFYVSFLDSNPSVVAVASPSDKKLSTFHVTMRIAFAMSMFIGRGASAEVLAGNHV